MVGGRLYDEHGRVSVEGADDELITTVKAMIARREWRQHRAVRISSVKNAIGRGVHLQAVFGYRQSDGKGTKLVRCPRRRRRSSGRSCCARRAGRGP